MLRLKESSQIIKPIETSYKGYKFRSRTEARWAVFLDACGVEWEYEPEGFHSNGLSYLPDFLLHGVKGRGGQWDGDLYIEVKGCTGEWNLTEDALKKARTFGRSYDSVVLPNDPNKLVKKDPQFCDRCVEKCSAYNRFREQNLGEFFNGRWYEYKYGCGSTLFSRKVSYNNSSAPKIEIDLPQVVVGECEPQHLSVPLVINGQQLEIPVVATPQRCVCRKYATAEQYFGWHGIPLLFVDNIFGCTSNPGLSWHITSMDITADFYSFRWIDGDIFQVCMGIDKKGGFLIDTCEDWDLVDEEATLWALKQAKQARFEHGEMPSPLSWQEYKKQVWDHPLQVFAK